MNVNDNGWLDKMIETEPQAREQIEAGDEFAPTGDETDANMLYADLVADPDPSADPFRKDVAEPAPDTA